MAFGENNAIFKFIESLWGNSLSWKRSEVRIGLTADPLEPAGIHHLSQGHLKGRCLLTLTFQTMIYELKDFLRSRFATLLLQTDV